MYKRQIDVSDIVDRSYETDIINEKYDFIEEIVEETLINKQEKEIDVYKRQVLMVAPSSRHSSGLSVAVLNFLLSIPDKLDNILPTICSLLISKLNNATCLVSPLEFGLAIFNAKLIANADFPIPCLLYTSQQPYIRYH